MKRGKQELKAATNAQSPVGEISRLTFQCSTGRHGIALAAGICADPYGPARCSWLAAGTLCRGAQRGRGLMLAPETGWRFHRTSRALVRAYSVRWLVVAGKSRSTCVRVRFVYREPSARKYEVASRSRKERSFANLRCSTSSRCLVLRALTGRVFFKHSSPCTAVCASYRPHADGRHIGSVYVSRGQLDHLQVERLYSWVNRTAFLGCVRGRASVASNMLKQSQSRSSMIVHSSGNREARQILQRAGRSYPTRPATAGPDSLRRTTRKVDRMYARQRLYMAAAARPLAFATSCVTND